MTHLDENDNLVDIRKIPTPLEETDTINVSSITPAKYQLNKLKSTLQAIQDKTINIKNIITSALGVTSFSGVESDHIIGRGSTKVTKKFLADSLISLIKVVDEIEPISNVSLDVNSPQASNIGELDEFQTI